jgi:hypothetical protein
MPLDFAFQQEGSMEYSKAKEVAEARNKDQANAYIDAGWSLLNVATMTTDSRDYNEPVIRYVMGWLQDSAVVQPRKTELFW